MSSPYDPPQGTIGLSSQVPQGPGTPAGPGVPQGTLGMAGGEGALQTPDLAKLPALQKLGLFLSSIAAGARGEADPVAQLQQQMQEQANAKRQAFQAGIGVLGQFNQILANTPMKDRAKAQAQLRGKFEQMAPGEGDFFDAFIGDPSLSQGLLEQAKDDPQAQAIISNPNYTEADLLDYLHSDQYRQGAADRQDKALLPGIQQKITGLLGSQAPTLQAAVQAALRDGKLTVEEIRNLNDRAGEGAQGYKLTPAELGTAERQQEFLANNIPGFTTSAEFQAGRKAENDFEKFRKQKELEHKLKLEEIDRAASQRLQAKGPAEPTYNKAAERQRGINDVKAVETLPAAINRGAELIKSLEAAKEAHAQLTVTGPILGRITPELSDAAQRLKSARRVILTKNNPLRGQGQVSNYERQLAEGTVPDSSIDAETAGPIYDRLIQDAKEALASDTQLLDASKRRLAGANPEVGGSAAPASSKPKVVIQNGHTYRLNEQTGEYE